MWASQRQPGDIVWRDGTVVGRHNGALRYTIGQRKGLGVAMAHPVYVTGVDAASNTVHLGELEDLTVGALLGERLDLERTGRPHGSRAFRRRYSRAC